MKREIGSYANEAATMLARKVSPTMKVAHYRKANHDIALNPCRCTICGMYLEMLTYPHTESHGYTDKYEMIRA